MITTGLGRPSERYRTDGLWDRGEDGTSTDCNAVVRPVELILIFQDPETQSDDAVSTDMALLSCVIQRREAASTGRRQPGQLQTQSECVVDRVYRLLPSPRSILLRSCSASLRESIMPT